MESRKYLKAMLFNYHAEFMKEKIFFGDIFNVIAKNKYTIYNVASTALSVADSVGKISSNAIDVVRKIKELRHKPSITDDAINKVLNAGNTPKFGNGFF